MLRGKRVFAVAAALALALILGGASLAGATTGSTNGFPEPKVVVPVPVANPFTGRYVVQAVGRGASIRSGEMKIDFSESWPRRSSSSAWSSSTATTPKGASKSTC
jgi:hypothetical protein